MTPDDHDEPEFEESDPLARELRAEIVRLQAQVDQLAADLRDQAAETAALGARLAELEEGLARFEARLRRERVCRWAVLVLSVLSLAASLVVSR